MKTATKLEIMFFCFIIIFAQSNSLLDASAALKDFGSNSYFDFIPVIRRADLDYELVRQHIINITSFGPRYTTYLGYRETVEYVKAWFEEYLEPLDDGWVQQYNLTVLRDYGGSLALSDGKTICIYPLESNEVAPVFVDELVGPIIDVGTGDLNKLDEKKVNGSIILMDFNSNYRWLDLAELGAKAVIFVEPWRTSRMEAFQKRLENIPFSFPRFYIETDEALGLRSSIREAKERGEELHGTLRAKTWWEMAEAENIMGLLKSEGRHGDEMILIGTYLDSYSVVPSISPGASESVNIAILLSLAKYLAENPPEYSVLFVLWSGHHQGLWGAREWTEKFIFGPDNPSDSEYYRAQSLAYNISAVTQIDVTPDSPLIYPVASGGFCLYGGGAVETEIANALIDAYYVLLEQTGKDYGLVPQGEWQEQSLVAAGRFLGGEYIRTPSYLRFVDAEILLAGPNLNIVPHVFFSTGRSSSVDLGTPTDTYENIEIRLPHVKSQMELLYAWISYLLNAFYIDMQEAREWGKPTHTIHTYRFRVNAKVRNWNISTGWYTEIPKYSENQTTLIVWYGGEEGAWTHGENRYGWRKLSVVLANEKDEADIIGVSVGSGAKFGVFKARVIDDKGQVTHVEDCGQYALPQKIELEEIASWNAKAKEVDNTLIIPVFRCGGVLFFDFVDPNYLDRSYVIMNLLAFYHDTHTSPLQYNIATDGTSSEYHNFGYSMAVAFLEAGKNYEFIIQSQYTANRPLAIITNSTIDNPEGNGYTINAGDMKIIGLLDYMKGLHHINYQRFKTVKQIMADKELIKSVDESVILLEEISQSVYFYRYTEAHRFAVDSWRLERDNYNRIRGFLEGAIFTVPFFCALMIPFVFLFERALTSGGGIKRILKLICIYAVLVLLFSLLHPGFVMASSIITVMLSFAILSLILPVAALIAAQTNSRIAEFRKKALGESYLEVARISMFTSAMSMGIGYMKKRRFRTILSVASIAILIFSLVLFTSISRTPVIRSTAYEPAIVPSYDGIVLQRESWGSILEGNRFGMSLKVLDYLQARYAGQGYVAPRLWAWPTHATNSKSGGFLITSLDNSDCKPYVIRAVLGLTPEERELTKADVALVGGRWFFENEKYSCVLPDVVARALGISENLSAPVDISLSGLVLKVVGVMGPTFDGIYDVNIKPLTPLDFSEVSGNIPLQLFYDQVIIVPFELWPEFDAYYQAGKKVTAMIASIAVKLYDGSSTLHEAEELYNILSTIGMEMWVFSQNNVRVLTVAQIVTGTGWQEQVVPLLIVCLTILNLNIAGCMDRKRDIQIFSTVGLSPTQVSLIFVAEATTYAVIGSMLGYIAAMLQGKIALSLGSDIFLNYASEYVAGAIGFALLVTLLSSIYPIILASRIVTPSMERRWKIGSKPRGNQWEIQLPFVLSSKNEAIGVLRFMKKYLELHESPLAPEFAISEITAIEEERIGEIDSLRLGAQVRLIPYELNIRQKVTLHIFAEKRSQWNVLLNVVRISGDIKDWVKRNHEFIDYIRKRFLLWRGLSDEDKTRYLEQEG